MKSFLEEYGFAILAAIVVILLIAMCTPVGNMIKTQVLNTVERFAGTADKKLASSDSDIMSANILGGTLYVQSASKTDKYHYVIHGTIKGELVVLDNDGNPVSKVEDGSELTGSEAVKEVSLASTVAGLDEGSVYYVEVINDGTGYTFMSNVVTKTDVSTGGSSGPTYEIVDGDKEGLHYHNDALFTGTCGGKDYVSGVEQPVVTYLSLDDKYVGYYADVDGNNTIDGVIFFDYAHGADTTFGYLGDGVAVTAKTSGLANYKMTEIDSKQVVQKATSGDDRFYVIALENTLPTTPVIADHAYWYNSAYSSGISDWPIVTSTAFGTGKTNTSTMLAKWNAEAYGAKNNRDMFTSIPDGWFVLSKDEWRVLGSELKKVSTGSYSSMTMDVGVTLSFSRYYWSSSVNGAYNANRADFGISRMYTHGIIGDNCTRVASTFWVM